MIRLLLKNGTDGGRLLKQLREAEHNLQQAGFKGYIKAKIIEQSGQKLKHILTQSDPWSKAACNRPQCSTCRGENCQLGSCKARNQVYENVCSLCHNKGQVSRYLGETAHSLWERNSDHQSDALSLNDPSHMREHMLQEHPGDLDKVVDVFSMSQKVLYST